MTRELRPLLVVTVVLMVLTTVVYPLVVTGVAQLVFPRQANGSLIEVGGQTVGSSLVGQTFTSAAYFHARPSAAGTGYDGASSSGSNYGPLSQKLHDRVAADAAAFREAHGLEAGAALPSDAVTASGSGLDPHISPATARLQVASVATARGTSEVNMRALLDEFTEGRALGLIGEPRVNVLRLNIALDARYPLRP
ncbi:MAG: K(+)-transporting ATPase subunit C [Dehalococcoidia bacterium]|nr:K(+)-transporting ATPase subunit C [Dehalococcoidia bacterium]